MADVTATAGEFSDVGRTVDIAEDDESSSKISALNQKIADLERENGKKILENEGYSKQIQDLESSIEELTNENIELKKQFKRAESDYRALESAAGRAAKLEGELSMLQRDLPSLEHDRRENIRELAEMKDELEGMKKRYKEKGVMLEAIGKERDSLLKEVGRLEGVVRSLRQILDGMEREKLSLIKNVKVLEATVERSKSLVKSRDELEETVDGMTRQIRNKGSTTTVGSKRKTWGAVIGGSTVAAVAVMGVAHFVHAARKY